ncbi:uncharacterized protein VDAG_01860 [Verticillium dahliae VdLs.17]|uniref:Mpv17/PMP22 family protein n=1 Tax=Verticillium dahliae (strain VdLs.17 / ATCC MYA-4575 / FGSC 10137) TaxID=498257 RepID=G2WW74_VERDV|nr:uncharacterized protein VDAG_01860 [Verticillium dahliae VdLs.17]EGY19844.1 hypothetical protein VDAG_01860 [Verticillium dahliae VdLs.17]KAH6706158.1 hypothetical protein EV126DRAFT_334734 [Verticillium dahliae]
MSLPPIVSVTLQGVVLSATSNLLAQALTSFRDDKPFIVDWVPVVQFIIWTIVNTPPNYLWYVMIAAQCWCSSHYAFFAPPLTNISRQDFLESTFPAYHAAPTTAAVEKAARSDDAALDQAAARSALVEPKLNMRNTLTKTLLDQTAGAAVNTFLFALFMNGLKAAMRRPAGLDDPAQSAAFLVSGAAVDYARVDWRAVLAQARREFVPIITAGWRLWPAVSLVNFAFVKTVPMRNLVGGLAGVGWGIYMSLFAAE